MGTLLEATRFATNEIQRRTDTERYFNDPVAWGEYMIGAHLWSKQRDVMQSVVTNKSTAVKAAHGVSKSYTAGFLACWWIDTRTARYDDTFVVTTAPSLQQVAGILWREIRTFKKMIDDRYAEGLIDHKLPGTINAFNEWKDERGKLIGFGRKPPDNKEESGLQGIHGHVFAVADEACGVSLDMIDALANITSNEGSRRLLIGNPTNPASHFGKIFKENTGVWSLHTISVFDSPHFTDEKETTPQHVLDVLTGPQYVEDKRLEYGENSARYKARVLGEFAWDLGDTLITPEDLAVAHDTEIHPLEADSVKLGVDIGRYGADRSVIYVNTGGRVRLYKAFDKNSLVQLANEVHNAAIDFGASEVRYDLQGIGQGFEELLFQLEPRPYKMIGLSGSSASPDRRQWYNARAYWWDRVRRQLREGSLDIDLGDENLNDELVMVEYKFAPSGGLLLESKDEMRKRGVKSPDFADAFVYASVDLTEMLNPEPKKQTTYEDAETVMGDDIPHYLGLLVQGW